MGTSIHFKGTSGKNKEKLIATPWQEGDPVELGKSSANYEKVKKHCAVLVAVGGKVGQTGSFKLFELDADEGDVDDLLASYALKFTRKNRVAVETVSPATGITDAALKDYHLFRWSPDGQVYYAVPLVRSVINEAGEGDEYEIGLTFSFGKEAPPDIEHGDTRTKPVKPVKIMLRVKLDGVGPHVVGAIGDSSLNFKSVTMRSTRVTINKGRLKDIKEGWVGVILRPDYLAADIGAYTVEESRFTIDEVLERDSFGVIPLSKANVLQYKKSDGNVAVMLQAP